MGSISRIKAACALFLVSLFLTVFVGCQKRILGPEIEYSQSDVELIRRELDRLYL